MRAFISNKITDYVSNGNRQRKHRVVIELGHYRLSDHLKIVTGSQMHT
jgi:hypothetical protein